MHKRLDHMKSPEASRHTHRASRYHQHLQELQALQGSSQRPGTAPKDVLGGTWGLLSSSVQFWHWYWYRYNTTFSNNSSSSFSICMGLSPGQYKDLVLFPQNHLDPYYSESHTSALQVNKDILAAVILWFMCLPLNTTISILCVLSYTGIT